MQFTLQTLMLAFVVVAAAAGLFGASGLVVSAVLLACAGYIRMSKDPEKAFYDVVVTFICLLPFCPCILFPLLLENDYPLLRESRPGPHSILTSPVWRVFLSLAILIGTTVLIVRRPLPGADDEKVEEEEEIRFEDTTAPEGTPERRWAEPDTAQERANRSPRGRGG
jgi:hypothetical protein